MKRIDTWARQSLVESAEFAGVLTPFTGKLNELPCLAELSNSFPSIVVPR